MRHDLLMAQRVTVLLEDDLDGTAADETLSFSLDGSSYEIDLTAEHAEQLRSALSSWTGSARKLGGRRSAEKAQQARGPARTDKDQLDVIRRWANSHGHPVNTRGRIPFAVRDAFDRARWTSS